MYSSGHLKLESDFLYYCIEAKLDKNHLFTYRGAWYAGLHVHRIHRDHLARTALPGLHLPELRIPEPSDGFHGIHQVVHGGAVEHPGPMPWRPRRLHDEPPHQPIRVKNPEHVRRRRLPLVEHEPDVEGAELLRLGELVEPILAADLLVGDERDVDGAGGREPRGAEAPDRLEVLDGEALVVLRAARVDAARGRVAVRGEGRVRPVLGLRGHGVDVGVEEHGGEGGVGAPPGEEEQRLGLARGEVERGGVEAERSGVGEEEGGGAGVVRGRVRRSDAEVFLEAGDLVGLESREGVGETGEAGEEHDEGEQEAARRRRRHRVVDALRCDCELSFQRSVLHCLFV